ncbi:shikimate kinase [Paenalcaligenes hermetiae]|uniref:Shikimate kinase n=2 Tax=Alcaligenaceae TaxID=506 RepID=A0ABP9LX92_9BURK
MTDFLSADLMQNEILTPLSPADLQRLLQPGHQSIFLIGMMGAGKTTLGRQLARHLKREFYDLDHELEARCGVPVATIFDIEGEAGFRRRETLELDICSRRPEIILATGGGAILAEANRHMLKERGTVVYLRANINELYRRLERDKTRPLLQTANPQERIASLLAEREPIYEQLADVVFETGSAPVHLAAKQLLDVLKEQEVIS